MFMLSFIVLLIVQSIAIHRIRKFCKMLVANNVFVNERFMLVHLFGFAWRATCTIISVTLILSHNLNKLEDEATDNEKRATLASLIFEILALPGCAIVISTMLYMFIKSSENVSKNKEKKIAREFLLAFAKIDDMENLNRERIDQHYQEVEKER